MTKADTVRILKKLAAAFPRAYSKLTGEGAEETVKLWAESFADDDKDVVGAAVLAYINTETKGFEPSVGQIRELMTKLTQPPQMTEAEAWGIVYGAICNSGYHAQAEFDALPPLLQRLVGSPAQLRDWSQMDADEVQSVVASNFQRSYRVRAKDWADYQALPGAIRERLDALAEGMAFPGDVKRLGAGT